jgi:hypothetical protein
MARVRPAVGLHVSGMSIQGQFHSLRPEPFPFMLTCQGVARERFGPRDCDFPKGFPQLTG